MTDTFPVSDSALRGEILFSTRTDVRGVLIPRITSEKEGHVTAAKAVLERSHADETLQQFSPPGLLAREALQASGLRNSADVGIPVSANLPDNLKGLYRDLDSIGVTVAHFADEATCAQVVSQLAEGYDFVGDFDLAMPSPIAAAGEEEENILFNTPAEDDDWREESGITEAHEKGVKGRGVMLGVLDTGIDIDHDNFRVGNRPNRNVPFVHIPAHRPNNIRRVRGFDTDGHGTHVCGILRGRNTGVAPLADMCVASVLESETTTTSFIRVLVGLQWLMRIFSGDVNKNRPAIINLSLGFPPVCPPNMGKEEYKNAETALRTIIRALDRANVLIVAAIGNDGESLYRLPGVYHEVLAVGAVDYSKQVPTFSGCAGPHGNKPDLVGYGVDVLSSWARTHKNDSTYKRLSGTSMAAPYVSGLAALYWSREPNLTSRQIRDAIFSEAQALRDAGHPHRFGRGLAVYNG